MSAADTIVLGAVGVALAGRLPPWRAGSQPAWGWLWLALAALAAAAATGPPRWGLPGLVGVAAGWWWLRASLALAGCWALLVCLAHLLHPGALARRHARKIGGWSVGISLGLAWTLHIGGVAAAEPETWERLIAAAAAHPVSALGLGGYLLWVVLALIAATRCLRRFAQLLGRRPAARWGLWLLTTGGLAATGGLAIAGGLLLVAAASVTLPAAALRLEPASVLGTAAWITAGASATLGVWVPRLTAHLGGYRTARRLRRLPLAFRRRSTGGRVALFGHLPWWAYRRVGLILGAWLELSPWAPLEQAEQIRAHAQTLGVPAADQDAYIAAQLLLRGQAQRAHGHPPGVPSSAFPDRPATVVLDEEVAWLIRVGRSTIIRDAA